MRAVDISDIRAEFGNYWQPIGIDRREGSRGGRPRSPQHVDEEDPFSDSSNHNYEDTHDC